MTRRHAPVLALVALASVAGLVLGLAPVASAAGGPAATELVVTGTVERFLVDDFAAQTAADDAAMTFVRTGSGAVQVPASALDAVADGATVRVGLADSATAEVSGAGVRPVAAASAPVSTDTEAGAAVTGVQVVAEPATVASASAATHHVLVVVAVPAGGTPSAVTAADLAAKVSGSVSTYWSRMTGGAVSFDATAYGRVVTTTTTPCSSGSVAGSFDFWKEIETRTGFVEGPGQHLVVYFDTLPACGGVAGLGTIGSDRGDGGLMWTNGYNTTGVIGHELGHNLSLGHSSTVSCTASGSRVTDAGAASCTKSSYRDTSDIMGVSWQNQGYLNASHLRFLGLLGSPGAQVQATTSGRTSLAPLASGAGTRALTLTDGATHYVLEYRTAAGQDAWMSGSQGWSTLGVTVRREFDPVTAPSFSDRESFLLDGDPSTPDSSFGSLDAALPEGSWVSLAGGALRVKVTWTSSAAAVLDYEVAGSPAAAPVPTANPAVTVLGVSSPVATLRTGAMVRTAAGPVVPLTWAWRVSTTAGVTAQHASATGLATSSWNTLTRTATATASDGSVWNAAGTATSYYRSDRVSTRYAGTWTVPALVAANGGSLHRSSTRYAVATTKVKGSSLAVLLQRGSHNGWVAVFVDGTKVATVNMRSTAGGVRVAFAKSFRTTGTHTVTVKNLTGGAHGAMGFDGVTVLG